MPRPGRAGAFTRVGAVATILLLIGAAQLARGPTASAQPGEPLESCVNFRHDEPGGAVEIDERWDPSTGGYTTLTIFWFIRDEGAAPGTYYWNHLVNGVAISAPHFDVKDDNLHTIFRMSEGWRYGDRYKFQAVHYAPSNNTSYVATVNECLIVPRM